MVTGRVYTAYDSQTSHDLCPRDSKLFERLLHDQLHGLQSSLRTRRTNTHVYPPHACGSKLRRWIQTPCKITVSLEATHTILKTSHKKKPERNAHDKPLLSLKVAILRRSWYVGVFETRTFTPQTFANWMRAGDDPCTKATKLVVHALLVPPAGMKLELQR